MALSEVIVIGGSTVFGSGVREDNRLLAQCALHLRQYNDALLINDTLRMMDAYHSLVDFYDTKSTAAIDGTDVFLLGVFQGGQSRFIFCTCCYTKLG